MYDILAFIKKILMSKYGPLETHLRRSGQTSVPMTFGEIEHVIGAKLPPSAFKHRPWWSNNPSNSVITHAWLGAGYKTAEVDMTGRKLVFRKSAPVDMSGEIGRIPVHSILKGMSHVTIRTAGNPLA